MELFGEEVYHELEILMPGQTLDSKVEPRTHRVRINLDRSVHGIHHGMLSLLVSPSIC